MLHQFHRLRRVLVLALSTVLGAGLLLAVAAPSQAIVAGSTAVSVSIDGYGTVTVGPMTPAGCTSPSTTPQPGAYACDSITGADHDTCTSDGAGGSECHVTVTATAPAGWHFGGWSGDCTGTQACALTTSVTECDPELKPPCSTEGVSHSLAATFVDDRAPTTTFSQAPSSNSVVWSDTPTQTFTWNTDEDNEAPSFQCTKDGGSSAPCSSGITWSSIADGVHTFCVQGTDASGLAGSQACRTWEQETNPTVSITNAPPATSSTRDATFLFRSNKSERADGSVLGFECSLDGSAYFGCSNGVSSYSGRLNGPHTFEVQATFTPAFGGSPHTSPAASYTWTQDDQTAPNVTVTDAPSGVVVDASRGAHIAWTGDDAADNQTFACKLDNAAFSACSSPLDLANLADGVHTVQIRGSNELGNTGPATSVTWDQEVPADTVITGGPADGSTVPGAGATFSFDSSKDGVQFQCKLDSGKYAPCSASGSDTLAHLSAGAHAFTVRAVWIAPLDSSTHYGAAVTRRWTVLLRPTCTVAPVSTTVVKGKVDVMVKCDQPGTAVVGGTVTETLTHKHGTTTKKVTLATRQTPVTAGKAATVTLSLGSAWTALKSGAKETAVFSVKASNAAGSKNAKSAQVRLRR